MKRLLFVFFSLLGLAAGVHADESPTYRAPTMLLDTHPAMQTPGFWIKRHPSPDAVIMDAEGINLLNQRIREKFKAVKDFLALPESFSGDDLSLELRNTVQELKEKGYFNSQGEPVSELFFQEVTSNLNLTSVPSVIEPQFGFVLRYTPQKFLPTNEGFYEKPGDVDFDYLRNNSLELATPVVILIKSFDNQWAYTLGPSSDGWVMTKDISPCAHKDIEEYLSQTSWSVVVEAKADVFEDAQLIQFDQYVQMGARFPREKKQETPGVVALKVPSLLGNGRFSFKTVYMDKRDVNDGFLPYTARTILKQAFKLLNESYGWGGMYGQQDCSRFLQQIFSTVGVALPRDSKDQSKVGVAVASFDPVTPAVAEAQKKDFFAKIKDGALILTLKGHIMLYLGNVDGKPYVIHSVWAYREPVEGEDRVRVINRVAVSGLDLGEGSKKGSLLKRLTGVRIFTK